MIAGKQGCIQRGFEWQVPPNYFGFRLPDDIAYNLSKVAVTSVVGTPLPHTLLPKFAAEDPQRSCWFWYLVCFTHTRSATRLRSRPNPTRTSCTLSVSCTLSPSRFASCKLLPEGTSKPSSADRLRFTFIAFIAQAAVIGNATRYSGDIINDQSNNVAIEWGQSTWLVLAAACVHFGWGYEAVRWRTKL